MKKKKAVKKINMILVKKNKNIDIDFAEDSYSTYFFNEMEDISELTEIKPEYDDAMFPEVEFYEDD